jgi:hypothetical protein
MLRSTSRLTYFSLATFATAILLSGCVTPSTTKDAKEAPKDTSVSTGDPELQKYIKLADPICETTRKKMAPNLAAFELHESVSGRARRKTVKVATPETVTKYVKEQLVQLETQQVSLRKLDLPKGESAQQLTDLWTKTDSVLAAVKKDPLSVYKDPFKPVAVALKELGFKECLQANRPVADAAKS